MYSLLLPIAVTLSSVVTRLDPMPEDEDIKAGYFAMFLWLGLLVVIGLLGWSMVRHLRTSESNRKAGFYPGNASEPGEPGDPTEPTGSSTSAERSS